jgi:sporulation related protein
LRQIIDERPTSSLSTLRENHEESVVQSRKTIGEEAKPLAWKTSQTPEVQKSETLQPDGNSLPSPVSEGQDSTVGKVDSPEQKPQAVAVVNNADRGGTTVIVPRGGTISDFVSRHYGENSALALSLVQEFNPQIGNLDVVSEGERLWMPPLTRDILLRQQPDKSYRFIASAFRSRRDAERWVHFLLSKGYSVEIVPQRVSNSMQIYRVEIGGLMNVTAADQVQELIDVQATRYAQRQERQSPQRELLTGNPLNLER